MSATAVQITLIPGNVAPRFDGQIEELELQGVAITEQGTASRLPLLDLYLEGPDGKRYLVVMTGRIACSIAAAVRGVNLRNHGVEEP